MKFKGGTPKEISVFGGDHDSIRIQSYWVRLTSFNGNRVIWHSVQVLHHVTEKKKQTYTIISKIILLLFFHTFIWCKKSY